MTSDICPQYNNPNFFSNVNISHNPLLHVVGKVIQHGCASNPNFFYWLFTVADLLGSSW